MPSGRTEKGFLMTVSNIPQCCGQSMFLVTGDRPYWNCPLCGNRRERDCTAISSAGIGFEHPDEPETGGNRAEHPEDGSRGSAHVTDHQPRCWKCGRMLGKYFSRPWSIRCRRCKANNQAH